MATKQAIREARKDKKIANFFSEETRGRKKAAADPTLPSESDLYNNVRDYCENLLWLRDKKGRVVPFIWNPVQVRLHDRLERETQSGRTRRLILKYRRPGISTYMQARNFFLTANRESQHAVTLAHDYPSTEKIFGISLLFYNKLPDWARPHRKTENKKELDFSLLGSQFYIGTAGGRDFGRGQTVQRVHCSEVAFYPKSVDVAVLMAGLLEACSHGEMDLESTANGHGNWFHRTWVGAKNNENAFVPIFLSWKDDPELVIPTTHDYEALHLNTEEEDLVKAYTLTPGQILWRRAKMRELFDPERGDSIFKQEYPINDVEAFIASGICFFDTDKIAFLANLCAPPKHIGDLNRFRVWEEARTYHSYVVGADIGEGVQGGCRTSISVMDSDTCEQVCAWTGITSPEDAGRKVAEIANLYNMALVAPEANNFGHSTLNTLLNEINYPYIYRHSDYNVIHTDEGEVVPKWGWQTNGKTRPLMLSELRHAIQGGLMKINDPEFFSECMTFADNGHGKYEATKDGFDDRIFANAIVWQARKRQMDVGSFDKYAVDTGHQSILSRWEGF